MNPESKIEQYLKKEVQRMGGVCLKLVGYIGIPDRIILLPGGVVLFVELKTEKGPTAKIQLWWGKTLKLLGLQHHIIKSKAAVDELLAQYRP